MQNSFIIFQKLLVLFGFMLIGYLSYKKKWISDDTSSQISGLIVNIFNPALIISGVIGSVGNGNWNLVIMDLILFVVLILISPAFVRILGVKKDERNIYAVMLIFSNLGFMGIPIIEELYGRGAIFYVALYTLVYNILFYTYGIYLFEKERAMQTGQKAKIIFHWKKMINPGMVACLAALLIFAFQIDAPAPAVSFVQYLGNAAIPLHDHYRGIFSKDATDRSFQRHQDVSVYIFKDAGDPNDRSICDPAVSFRSCSLRDHGINVWNAKWKHGSDDGNRLWIRQFDLQQRNRADNFIIDHNITNCGILDLRK